MSNIYNYRDMNRKQTEKTETFRNSSVDIQYNCKNTKNIYWDTINNGKKMYNSENYMYNSNNIYIDVSEHCCANCHRLVGCFDSFKRTVCCGKKMCSHCKYCCAGCRQTVCYEHAHQHNKKSKKCFKYMHAYLVRGGFIIA